MRSRKGQKKGAGLESWLKRTAKVNGIWLRHNTPPMQILRRDQRDGRLVTCRLEGKGWVDFTATLNDGLSCDFDAKDVVWDGKSRRWSLGTRLRGHQGQTLTRLDHMGHVAFVYLRRRRLVRCQDYVIPAHVIKDGPASILWDDLEPWAIPPGLTWIEPVCSWWTGYREQGWKLITEDRWAG